MQLKPGSRWRSAVDTAEVVVVRPPKGEVELACGGHPMLALGQVAADGLSIDPAFAGGIAVGKRYVDPDSGLELLGSKAGKGSLSVGGRTLSPKEAKALPASD